LKNPKVSVVVPIYNAGETLALCLEGLSGLRYDNYEVFLVDNSSTDNSLDIAKRYSSQNPDKFKCITENHQGPSYARNTGAKKATGEILAFTDADCIPDADWLNTIVQPFEKDEIGAVAGRVTGFELTTTLDKFHCLFTLRGFPNSQTHSEFLLVRGGFPTANLAVRKGLFDAIGGFDITMKIYSEDYDLCARIYQAKFKIRYIANALVSHRHRNTYTGTWKQSFGFGRGHTVLLKRHLPNLIILDLPRWQHIFTEAPFRGWIDLAGADKKLFFILVAGFLWTPCFFLMMVYLGLLYVDLNSRQEKECLGASYPEVVQLVFLLLYKSTALTSGRLYGALKNKVLCI